MKFYHWSGHILSTSAHGANTLDSTGIPCSLVALGNQPSLKDVIFLISQLHSMYT